MVLACKFLIAGALAPAAVMAHGDHGGPKGLCGVKGYDKGKPKPYFISTTPEEGTQGECTMKCATDDKCKSYATGKGKCKMFEADVEHNIVRRESGPFTFYDRDCISHWATTSASIRSQQSRDMASASKRGEAMAKAESSRRAAMTNHDEL